MNNEFIRESCENSFEEIKIGFSPREEECDLDIDEEECDLDIDEE